MGQDAISSCPASVSGQPRALSLSPLQASPSSVLLLFSPSTHSDKNTNIALQHSEDDQLGKVKRGKSVPTHSLVQTFLKFILRFRVTERERFYPLVYSPNGCNWPHWARRKPGASSRFSMEVAGAQTLDPFSDAFSKSTSRKLDQKCNGQDSNQHLIWDAYNAGRSFI